MPRKQIDFTIQEAGCLIYAADRNFGGEPFTRLDDFFGGAAGLKELVLQGAIIPASLYQDDGYNVRVCRDGDLTDEEKAEWTSRAAWKLNLESGQMVVSGVIPEDDELSEFEAAENGGEYWTGCFLEIPKGEYAATIYSYPPNDLAGGWMRLEKPDLFKMCFSSTADLQYEKPLDYFNRTRANETPPGWIKDGYEQANFLDFLIHLVPLAGDLKMPGFEPDGCLVWEYRKPEICPVGIRL